MDNHPIPQDVTGFQFKLIGTMTVKQFGYVGSGVVMAVILYYLPLHSAFGVLLKVFLIPFLGSIGAIIAFVPVDGRPIDVMATNFVKAVFSPNQYVYHRQGKQLSFSAVTLTKAPTAKNSQKEAQTKAPLSAAKQLDEKEEKLRALLLSSRGRIKNDTDKKEAAFLKTLTLPTSPSPMAMTKPATPNQPPIISTPKPFPLPVRAIPQPLPPFVAATKPALPQVSPPPPVTPKNNSDDLLKKESELEQELSQAQKEESISTTPASHTAAQQKIAVLSKQIQEIHAQKQQLEQELSHLQNQLNTQKGTVAPLSKPASSTQPSQDPQHVRTIPQNVTKKAGLPHVSDSPNVVVGIVKDPRGNILPNILVEVKDKDGNPVRAFKTNQLGQFASATPLSPGTYNIELEDPKKLQRFDIIQITANNTILLPIEVISHDAREELRKQLFAN